MYYKQKQGAIMCVRSDDGLITQYLPHKEDVVTGESLEWIHTDKQIIRLDDFSFVFEDDPRVLDSAKQAKIAELGATFNDRVAGSFTTSHGYLMQFDTSDSLKMQGAIQLLEATEQTEGYLTQANDETVYHVPLETMKAVLVEMLAAYAACHARKQELRALINAAETAEELDEIIISWPV